MIAKRVILKGGFGNQLFQWAFAHYIVSQGYNVTLIAFESSRGSWKSQNKSSRFMNIRTLMETCKCFEMKSYSLRIPIYRRFRDVESKRHPLRNIPGYYQNFDDKPFQAISNSEISRTKYFSGYFQNYQLVKKVESTLVSELQDFLKLHSTNDSSHSETYPNIMHIRRGDFSTPSHFFNIGILSSSYYQRALNSIQARPWTLLTDDPQHVLDITSKIDTDRVLGPDSLDTISALHAMSNSKNLIISNSTLAWWGGLLSIHQGGRVQAPVPWYRDDILDKANIILHDAFQKVPSDFLEDLTEYELAHLSEPMQPELGGL